MVEPNQEFWNGKRVLLTGHTGFKGAWLALWLTRLGAEVVGVALEPDTSPNLFDEAKIAQRIFASHFCDIRHAGALRKVVQDTQPEIIFHLAAQALVLTGYEEPLATFDTNVMGTANLLDAARHCDSVRSILAVTTDKVYENNEQNRPFCEEDRLGGRDPYSASKAACELVINCYRQSYLVDRNVALASARAGNVIGGGDWSKNRLIPDAVRAWGSQAPLTIRNPHATRPWQHVLEPLAAYLRLAEFIHKQPDLAECYNFGPSPDEAATVREVIEIAQPVFGQGETVWGDVSSDAYEARWLSLDNAKASKMLDVIPKWSLQEGVARTMAWYRQYLQGGDALALCEADIVAFSKKEGE